MANPISNWLGSLASGASNAASKINPAQLAFANYQLNGAKDDRDAAVGQNTQAQQYLKDQLDRNTGLADSLTGKVNANLAGDGKWDSLFAGIKAGTIDPTTKGFMDSATALGDKREASNDLEKGKLQDSITNVGKQAGDLYAGFGPRKTYGEQDIADISSDIYNKKVGAVDRSVRLASSQGFAGALTRGLSDSTQAADTRDDVARRFSDTYSNLDANSRTEATNLVNSLSNLQGSQRSAAMSELLSSLSPELQARIATYKPDNTAIVVANDNANLARDDLLRQKKLLVAVGGRDERQLEALLLALTKANERSSNAAGTIATNASTNLQAVAKALGETRGGAVAALSPAVQALLGGADVGGASSSLGSPILLWLQALAASASDDGTSADSDSGVSWGDVFRGIELPETTP